MHMHTMRIGNTDYCDSICFNHKEIAVMSMYLTTAPQTIVYSSGCGLMSRYVSVTYRLK